MVGTRPVVNLKLDVGALGLFGRMLLAGICFLFVIPAAWGVVPFVRWFVERVRFSDGTSARFEGRPGDVWYLFSLLALISIAPSFISNVYQNQLALVWGMRLVVVVLSALIAVPLWRWYAANIRLGSTADLRFEGTYLPVIGFSLLVQISIFTIIGWAWATTAFQRWLMRQIKSDEVEISFVGSGLGYLWRAVLGLLACMFIIPIPWIMRWLIGWFIENTVITRTNVVASAGGFDSSWLPQDNQASVAALFTTPIATPMAMPSKDIQSGAGVPFSTPTNVESSRAFRAAASEDAYNRGVALFGAGRLAEALAAFDACIQQGVYVPEAAFARARCSLGLGQRVEIPPQLADPELAGVRAAATNLACYLISQGFQATTAQRDGSAAVSATRGGPIHHITVTSVYGQYSTNVEREQGGRRISLTDAAVLDQTELDRWFVRVCSSDLSQLPLSPLPPGGLATTSGPA